MAGRTIVFFFVISLLAIGLWYLVYYFMGYLGTMAKDKAKKIRQIHKNISDDFRESLDLDDEDDDEELIKQLKEIRRQTRGF